MEPGHPMRNIVSRGIAVFFLGFAGFSSTYASPNGGTGPPAHSHDISGSTREVRPVESPFRILPDVSAMIEAGGVAGGDYDFQTRRQVAIDLLTLHEWFLHFEITETDLFDPSPSQIDHEFQYLRIGRETTRGDRVTLFWDHTCHNPTRELPRDEYNGIHWHEVGVGYETSSMRPGHENDGIEFNSETEWLNAINWDASFSKVAVITDNDYNWMFKLDIRDDIIRSGRHVIFAQLDLNTIYDDRGINLSPRLEIGDRIRLNRNTSLIPFLSYERYRDWYDLEDGEQFFVAGIRMQGNLGVHRDTGIGFREDNDPGTAARKETGSEDPDQQSQQNRNLHWTPRFHVDGGYASVLDSDEYGYNSDVAIDLDLLEWDSNTLSLDTYTGVLTPPGDLVPDFIQHSIGASLKTDWGDFLARSDSRVFYSYSCLYGVDYEHRVRDYSLIGLELTNDVSSWNWGVQVGCYPFTTRYDYWGQLLVSVSYDFRREGLTPYVGCAGQYLPGDDSKFGYEVESGVRIPGDTGDLEIYLRLQDDFDIFKFGTGRQGLVGLRLLFL
jgi:hypothetical protein